MSQKRKISIKVAGAAGQGVESGGQGLAKALRRGGLHIFGVSDYMSLIKGGHNFFQITVSDEQVHAHTESFDLMVTFDHNTNIAENVLDIQTLRPGALFLVDEGDLKPDILQALENNKVHHCPMPLSRIATELGGSKIMMNTVALGGVAGLMRLPFEKLEQVITENFGKKSQDLAAKNVAVARAGYDYALEHYGSKFDNPLPYNSQMGDRMLINGNEAIAMGSYAAGCRFISAYPMTPGTSVFEWFTKRNKKLGVVTKHTEDEIAAICMAIGASQVGARAMTTTSGGGFCLMVEALGLAGITEVPIVVVNAQRGGPSTGLPTRTEQADLLFAINASHGEFPRAVFTPGTIEQCYEAGVRAHNFAAKYQMPAIILTDQLLAAEIRDTDPESFQPAFIDRGKFLTAQDLDVLDGPYLRFQFTEDGVSPRALQGSHPRVVYAPATDEHDETGHITEDADNRIRMMNKRMHKLEEARKEIQGPSFYGPEEAHLTLVVWGSTYGAAREAVELFNRQSENLRINLLHFNEVWPFPLEKTLTAWKNIKTSLAVEQNYTAQFCKLLGAEAGLKVDEQLLRYDGRPICPEEIVRKVNAVLSSNLVVA